jgi:hypothetical protein
VSVNYPKNGRFDKKAGVIDNNTLTGALSRGNQVFVLISGSGIKETFYTYRARDAKVGNGDELKDSSNLTDALWDVINDKTP